MGRKLDVLLALTGLVFICLKVTGAVQWSWWIVVLPFIAIVIIDLIVLGAGVIMSVLAAVAAVIAIPVIRAEERRNAKRKSLWEEKDAQWRKEREAAKDAS